MIRHAMSRLAAGLRRETLNAAKDLTASQRLELALRLGLSDLQLCLSGSGGSEDEARRRLERQRAMGRRASACTAGR
jgi:hypothetical protein